jgi:hypothetical protein
MELSWHKHVNVFLPWLLRLVRVAGSSAHPRLATVAGSGAGAWSGGRYSPEPSRHYRLPLGLAGDSDTTTSDWFV